MTAYYYAQGGTVVVGVAHNLEEVYDRTIYGASTYVIVDLLGTFPSFDVTNGIYDYPTVTNQMQSDSAKGECEYRIFKEVSANAQRNINAYVAGLAANAANTDTAMTAGQIADCNMAAAIAAWIGRPSGMLAACDTLIAAHDMQWYLSGKWPAWDPSAAGWSTFVARF
jgi:thioesterase domain-containing protein